MVERAPVKEVAVTSSKVQSNRGGAKDDVNRVLEDKNSQISKLLSQIQSMENTHKIEIA